MSISGIGSAYPYIYKNVNKSNNRNKRADLFNQVGITTASNSRGVSEQSFNCRKDEECKDKSVEVSDVKRPPSVAGWDGETHVTEIAVWSLFNGFSFYLNEDTGEISCVNDYDSRPGRHALWSKTILPEDRERVYNQLFDRYKDVAAGDFVYRYRAYLMHEEFWDMYLESKVDLKTLVEHDDTLSENELYNKFLRDTANRDH